MNKNLNKLLKEADEIMKPVCKPPHKVYGLKKDLDVRHVVLFDTETFPTDFPGLKRKAVIQKLYLGWMFYLTLKDNKVVQRREHEFTEVEDFWGHLESIDTTKYKGDVLVMAFNIDYDANIVGIREQLQKRGWTVNKPEIGNNVYIWSLEFKEQKYVFLDIGNFIGGFATLKLVGEAVGIEKMDVSFADGKTVKDYPRELISEYCKVDVAITEAYFMFWLKFLAENDCGQFKHTLASQCMTAFRHLYPDIAESIVAHGIKSLWEFEHKAYHGGWVEMYYKGKVNYAYELDVNSFHPWIMRNMLLPHQTSEDETDAFIIDAAIWSPERLIPTKDKNGRLVFPVGKYRASFTSVELERLLKIGGRVLKVYKKQHYKTRVLFKDYVDTFFELKQKYSNPRIEVLRNMAKYFNNALEGKWAQQSDCTVDLGTTDKIGSYWEVDSGGHNRYVKHFGGHKYTNEGMDEGYYNFVSISSFIRAYTRVYLSQWMQTIREAGGKVFYTDTDSLHVDAKGLKVMQDLGLVGDELGQLEIKKEGKAEYRNLKDYTIGDFVARKGVKASAKPNPNGKGFIQDKFMRSAGMNAIGIGTGVIVQLDVPLVPKGVYNKGRAVDSGWTLPTVMNEETLTKDEKDELRKRFGDEVLQKTTQSKL